MFELLVEMPRGGLTGQLRRASSRGTQLEELEEFLLI